MLRRSVFKYLALALLSSQVVLLSPQAMAGQGCLRSVISFLSPHRGPELTVMDGRTIRAIRKIKGKHGGYRYLMQPKFLEGWHSNENPTAPQGSPLYVFEVLDPDVASFLGYEWTSEGITVPDHDELMGAFKSLNAQMKGEDSPLIKMKLYIEPNLQAPEEKYLFKIGFEGAFPWAKEGAYFHHDLNFHVLLGLMFPEELFQLLRSQLISIFEFREFLKKTHPELLGNPKIEKIFKRIFTDLSLKIDVGTATFSLFSKDFRDGDTTNFLVKERVQRGLARIQILVGDGKSPKHFLSNELEKAMDLTQLSSEGADAPLRADFEKILKEFQETKLKQEPQYDVGIPEVENPLWLKPLLVTRVNAIHSEIRRIQALRP